MTYLLLSSFHFFFFNDTATTEIYTLSLHDALPILPRRVPLPLARTEVPSLQIPHFAMPVSKCFGSLPRDVSARGPDNFSLSRSQVSMSRIDSHAFVGFRLVILRISPVVSSFTLEVCAASPAMVGLVRTCLSVLPFHFPPDALGMPFW